MICLACGSIALGRESMVALPGIFQSSKDLFPTYFEKLFWNFEDVFYALIKSVERRLAKPNLDKPKVNVIFWKFYSSIRVEGLNNLNMLSCSSSLNVPQNIP